MSTRDKKSAESLAKQVAESCIGARVRMLNRTVTRIYDDALREYGLKFSQMNILTIIALKGPIQPAEVARVLALEKSTLSRNVRLMETAGWVTASRTSNGNSQLLKITRKGKSLYQKAWPAWEHAQAATKTLLGPQASRSIARAADRTRNAEN